MGSEKSPQQVPTTLLELAKLLLQMFGPQTFGVVLLVIVWIIMVRPTLDRNTSQDVDQRNLLEDLRMHNAELKELTSHMKTTAEILDRNLMRTESK